MIERAGIHSDEPVFDESGIYRDELGVLHYQDLPDSLVDLVVKAAESHAELVALQEIGGGELTYAGLLEAVERVAGGLAASGVEPGDRVGLMLPNGNDFVVAFFGIIFAGAAVVPINTRFTESEAAYVLEDSGAKYVFRPGVVMPSGEPLRHQGAGRATLAAIFYTSGTTGFPKGAMLSHENFLSNMESVFRVVPLERGPSVSLVTVPLFHVTAAIAQMVPTLRYGGKLVILPGPDIKALIAAVAENQIDTVVSVPALYWYVLVQPEFAALDKSGVKYVLYGGAPMPPDLVHKLMAAFPSARVGNGFGLTETASIATFLPHEYAGDHADSVGFPVPVTEVDLFEPDPHTGAGELLIRGPNVAMGYWNMPEATRDTFVDGWLHTGDMARIVDGLVIIVDRKKDMINRGGENVYSVEVENVLAAYPGVLEVAVIGVPDEMMGEKVGAVVVPVPGVSFDVAEMVSFARTKLADYKVPQYVWVRQEGLPRNAGGKVLKPRLRAEAQWEQVVF